MADPRDFLKKIGKTREHYASCPRCQNPWNLKTEDLEIDDPIAYGQHLCPECDAGWHSAYRFVGNTLNAIVPWSVGQWSQAEPGRDYVRPGTPWVCEHCGSTAEALEHRTETCQPNVGVLRVNTCKSCGKDTAMYFEFEKVTDFMGDVMPEALDLVDCLLEGHGPRMDALKKGRTQLDDEERAEVMQRGAVWHHGPGGEATPAVWKSVVNGTTWYVCNTHRAYQAKKSLKGAINAFKFIKTTS